VFLFEALPFGVEGAALDGERVPHVAGDFDEGALDAMLGVADALLGALLDELGVFDPPGQVRHVPAPLLEVGDHVARPALPVKCRLEFLRGGAMLRRGRQPAPSLLALPGLHVCEAFASRGDHDMPVWRRLKLRTRDDLGMVMLALADDRQRVLAARLED
jgi:hypothetical protein